MYEHASYSDMPRIDYSLFYYFLLWFILVAVSLAFIFIHGIEYVNWPRLLPLSDIVHYDGPGFRSGHNGKGLGKPSLDSAQDEKAFSKRRRAGSRLGEVEMGEKQRTD
jgi:phosphatidylinositol 4-phosphatase